MSAIRCAECGGPLEGWAGEHHSPQCSSTYQRGTYTLRRFEVVAPHVRNDGTLSGYAGAFAAALARVGFDGWTESITVGWWWGRRERGTTFLIFSEDERDDHVTEVRMFTADLLARIARELMPDQDAIQLVIGETVTLREA